MTGTRSEPVGWADGRELDAAAEAAWIEHELQIRGDGMWQPWHSLDRIKREHWERIATAVLRAMNLNRMSS